MNAHNFAGIARRYNARAICARACRDTTLAIRCTKLRDLAMRRARAYRGAQS